MYIHIYACVSLHYQISYVHIYAQSTVHTQALYKYQQISIFKHKLAIVRPE